MAMLSLTACLIILPLVIKVRLKSAAQSKLSYSAEKPKPTGAPHPLTLQVCCQAGLFSNDEFIMTRFHVP